MRSKHPFRADAIVMLPDHLHCIWMLPPEDADFATRWRLIKTWFTKHRDPALRVPAKPARTRKAEQALWQHRYWEHLLRDETDFTRHVEYIHQPGEAWLRERFANPTYTVLMQDLCVREDGGTRSAVSR